MHIYIRTHNRNWITIYIEEMQIQERKKKNDCVEQPKKEQRFTNSLWKCALSEKFVAATRRVQELIVNEFIFGALRGWTKTLRYYGEVSSLEGLQHRRCAPRPLSATGPPRRPLATVGAVVACGLVTAVSTALSVADSPDLVCNLAVCFASRGLSKTATAEPNRRGALPPPLRADMMT